MLTEKNAAVAEAGLDPENWEEVRALGHRIIDDFIQYFSDSRNRPAWTPVPDAIKKTFTSPLPEMPQHPSAIYDEFKKTVLPYAIGTTHPSFFAWVMGSGTALGAYADLLAGMMNVNATIGDQSALYLDNQVVSWCRQMFRFPSEASGLLVSGASIANITAMIVARNSADEKMKLDGVYSVKEKLTAYCSRETHSCITKAMEVIGLGSEQLRKINTDDDYRINLSLLQRKIKEDRNNGFHPFCIIGNAGTVNTGAIDPMDELLAISRKEKIWLHVDGAFGAFAKLVPSFESELKALEEVESLAFDLHKWMYMPYEVGCVLIRDKELHRRTFAVPASYLSKHERGLAGGPDPVTNYGMELSRGFKALKVWMSLKEHGMEKYRAMIAQNIDQAKYLGQLVEQSSHFELLAAVSMNIVCYRYNPGNMSQSELNELNKEIVMRIHESGVAAPSYAILKGSYAIRVAITNHRTRKGDLENLIKTTKEIAKKIIQSSQ